MRIEISTGPEGASKHQSTHYVYDSRSGIIIAVHHFAGAAPESEDNRREELLGTAQESTRIAREHLAILKNPEIPPGRGELRVEHASRRLVRENDPIEKRLGV